MPSSGYIPGAIMGCNTDMVNFPMVPLVFAVAFFE
jgi:hypothetical protein